METSSKVHRLREHYYEQLAEELMYLMQKSGGVHVKDWYKAKEQFMEWLEDNVE